MSWVRERYSFAPIWPITAKNQRLVLVVLLHQRRILESLQHGRLALNSSIRNVADLVAVESTSMLSKIPMVKRENILVVNKVNKSIPSIAPVLEINR